MKSGGDEDGSAVAELVVIAPLIGLVALVVVAFGRFATASGDVADAARAGAASAVVQADPAGAQGAADDAARSSLSASGLTCTNSVENVDLSGFHPGGWVTVTVACTASVSDLAIPGVPGSKTFTASATAPVEPYRPDPSTSNQ